MTEQAEALSEMDAASQIANLLDGPEEDRPEEEEQAEAPLDEGEEIVEEEAAEAEEPEYEELTWNGETKKIPKAELKELAQKGFDYTQKTQQLADARKAFEQQVQMAQQQAQLQQASIDLITQVKSMDAQLEQFKAVDWTALADSDPIQYLKLNQTYRDLKEARQEKIGEFQHHAQQLQQSQQHMSERMLAEQSAKLAAKMPELTKAESKQALKSYLSEAGYSDVEISGLTDHRSAIIAYKAMQYDKLQATKPLLTKKVAEVPKVLKPGSQKPVQKGPDKDLMSQLKKTGKSDYAAKLIEQML